MNRKTVNGRIIKNIRTKLFCVVAGLALSPLGGCGEELAPTASQQSEIQVAGPFRISYGSDPLQFGDLRVPAGAGKRPVAVVIHGGCWSNLIGLDFNDAMSAALAEAGVATWNIEYRRIGDLGGGYPNTLTDVGAAVDKLRDLAEPYGLDLENVVTVGHSAGGHLAVWVAARQGFPANHPLRGANPLPLAASVPLAGIFDLDRYYNLNLCGEFVGPFMGGSPSEVPERYALASPVKLLPIGTPQTLIHGTLDDIVPIGLSRDYKAEARHAGDKVWLKELNNGDHFDVITPTSPKWPEVSKQILKVVKHGNEEHGNDDN